MITYLMCDRIEGRPLYSPPQKHIIPAVIGAAAVLGSTFAQMATNSNNREEQARINRENMDFQREMFDKKMARENYLNANSALIQRQALEKAGLNPNIGSYGQLQSNLPNVSPSSQAAMMQNPMSSPEISSLASLIQNQPLVDAQAKKTKEEARSLAIQNNREETVDNNLNTFFRDWFNKNPSGDGFVVTGKYQNYNKGTLTAQQLSKEWEVHSKELKALDIKYQIDKLVYDSQLENSDTINSIAEMPVLAKKKLYNEVLSLAKNQEVMDTVIALNNANKEKVDAETEFIKFQKQLAENSNVHALIDKYLPDSSFGDFAHFMAIVLSSLTGRVSGSFKMN